MSAHAAIAMTHHCGVTPNHWSSSGVAADPITPYRPTWSALYASSATQDAPTPSGRPSPWLM